MAGNIVSARLFIPEGGTASVRFRLYPTNSTSKCFMALDVDDLSLTTSSPEVLDEIATQARKAASALRVQLLAEETADKVKVEAAAVEEERTVAKELEVIEA